jgi:sugar O-acyltransferase (sialic acid O-acetyltransferase NeuD family)
MKHLIIIGAGGLGRCIYDVARQSIGYGTDFDIKGFIDDNQQALDGLANYPPLISSISDYQILEDDVFVCAMGNTQVKKKIVDKMKANGALFQTIIHHSAVIGTNTIIGNGSVIFEYVIISPDTIIGQNTLVQNFAVIGHDCKIGENVRIDTHCTCVGGTIVHDGATLHTGSVINHNVEVGEYAVIAACSFVIKKVDPFTTVMGNPAKTIFVSKSHMSE